MPALDLLHLRTPIVRDEPLRHVPTELIFVALYDKHRPSSARMLFVQFSGRETPARMQDVRTLNETVPVLHTLQDTGCHVVLDLLSGLASLSAREGFEHFLLCCVHLREERHVE